jgi:hypothetical protein
MHPLHRHQARQVPPLRAAEMVAPDAATAASTAPPGQCSCLISAAKCTLVPGPCHSEAGFLLGRESGAWVSWLSEVRCSHFSADIFLCLEAKRSMPRGHKVPTDVQRDLEAHLSSADPTRA